MAQNATITLTAGTWTQLTDADISSITFQNRSEYDVFVTVQNGTTAPTTFDDAIKYGPGQGERNATLSDLAPGVTSPNRVFAWSKVAADVFVSHA